MVSWSCFVILPVIGLALLGTWLALFLTSPEGDEDMIQPLLIGGAVILGLCLINLIAYLVIKVKAGKVKDEEGFPASRTAFWSIPLGLHTVLLTFFISWPLGWFIQGFVVLIIYPFVSEKTRLRVSGMVSVAANAMFSVWLSPFWHVKVVRRPAGGIPEKTIVMPNHLSFSDGFVVGSALWPYEAKFAATSWVFKIPFGGWMLKRAGYLRIKLDRVDPETNEGRRFRPDKEVAKKSLEQAKRYLDQGTRVGVFPEGGISPDGGYTFKEFRNGFFRLAIEHEASITPVATWGAQTMWVHEAPYPQSGYAEVAIGDPIPVSKDDDLEEVKQRYRKALTELRDDLPFYKKTKDLKHRITLVV